MKFKYIKIIFKMYNIVYYYLLLKSVQIFNFYWYIKFQFFNIFYSFKKKKKKKKVKLPELKQPEINIYI